MQLLGHTSEKTRQQLHLERFIDSGFLLKFVWVQMAQLQYGIIKSLRTHSQKVPVPDMMCHEGLLLM
jgi:hypothetical protein